MIWIVLIIIAVIGKFLYDRHKLLNNIHSNGGLVVKYKILIDYMLSRTGGNITSKGKDQVNIDYVGNGTLTHFSIISGFKTVIIKWIFKCEPLATYKHDWEFDESKVSQEQMISLIDQDIEIKTKPLLQILPETQNSNVEKTLTVEKSDNYNIESKEQFDLMLNGIIKHLFLPLDKQSKAFVLSVFMQIEHNNPFIDKLYKDNQDIFIYSEFEQAYNYFLNILLDTELGINAIVLVLKSIKNYSEIARLTAILFAVQGNVDESNEHLEIATKAWEKLRDSESRYAYNLFKTKVELLIFSNHYFEAATICENVWSSLQSDEHIQNIGWLKYQFAITIIVISKMVKVNLPIDAIFDSLDQLEEIAIAEEYA